MKRCALSVVCCIAVLLGRSTTWAWVGGLCRAPSTAWSVCRQAKQTPYTSDEYWTRKAREDGVSGPTLGVGRPPAEGSRGGTGRNRRNRDDRWPRPARAYYKLEELDRRLNLFQAGDRVLDLGCWPGSWTLYAAKKVGPSGRVLGIDLKEVSIPLPSNAKTRVEDAFRFKGSNVPMLDAVISDMAPRTMGQRSADQGRSTELVEVVMSIADLKLKEGGSMIAKHFEGASTEELRLKMKARYELCRIIKTRASRTQSCELYLCCLGKKPMSLEAPSTWQAPPRVQRTRRKPAPRNYNGW
ncbi:unnamed protein product [Durusdinium trenchii]|uniref:rRNA methyltransferase 2, mitochondrial n=1 Tax=Durusdinium trenchii TaxID=1381693 RepID=A0ABP0J054_9DINO